MYAASFEQLITQDVKFTPPRWMREDLWAEVAGKLQNYSQTALQQFTQADG